MFKWHFSSLLVKDLRQQVDFLLPDLASCYILLFPFKMPLTGGLWTIFSSSKFHWPLMDKAGFQLFLSSSAQSFKWDLIRKAYSSLSEAEFIIKILAYFFISTVMYCSWSMPTWCFRSLHFGLTGLLSGRYECIPGCKCPRVRPSLCYNKYKEFLSHVV